MSDLLQENAKKIFSEMMSHPILFTHQHPRKVALIGDEDDRILQEVLKHSKVTEIHQIKSNPTLAEHPSHVKLFISHPDHGINHLGNHALDVLINVQTTRTDLLKNYYDSLNPEGILIQAGYSPFEFNQLKESAKQLQQAGFHDFQILNFPNPSETTGWQIAIMALKQGIFKRISEKNIFNKSFKTHYYNFDIHQAATVLPQFMRDEWVL